MLAGFHLGLDYLFLVLYPTSVALGCGVAIPYVLSRQTGLAYLAWAQIMTSLLDGTENFALFHLLQGTQSESLAHVAWWCAAVKFGLFFAGLAYVLFVPASLKVIDVVRKSEESCGSSS